MHGNNISYCVFMCTFQQYMQVVEQKKHTSKAYEVTDENNKDDDVNDDDDVDNAFLVNRKIGAGLSVYRWCFRFVFFYFDMWLTLIFALRLRLIWKVCYAFGAKNQS